MKYIFSLDCVLTFGKHKGDTLRNLIETDNYYFNWFISRDNITIVSSKETQNTVQEKYEQPSRDTSMADDLHFEGFMQHMDESWGM